MINGTILAVYIDGKVIDRGISFSLKQGERQFLEVDMLSSTNGDRYSNLYNIGDIISEQVDFDVVLKDGKIFSGHGKIVSVLVVAKVEKAVITTIKIEY